MESSQVLHWTKNLQKNVQEKKINTINISTDRDPVPDYVRVILVTDMNGRKRNLYIPSSLDLDRPKRPRTNFSSEQLKILEIEFDENHFITENKRQILSQTLNLTETQVKVWFQNRRTKWRRQELSSSSSSSSRSKTSTTFPTYATPSPSPLSLSLSFQEHYYKNYMSQFLSSSSSSQVKVLQ